MNSDTADTIKAFAYIALTLAALLVAGWAEGL